MITKHVLFAAVVIASAVFAGAAMAGQGGGHANALAPGQTGVSPGQVFKSEDPATAVPPGQQYNQDRTLNSDTLPPGQTFTNPGRSKP
jgi:hypothetical protein